MKELILSLQVFLDKEIKFKPYIGTGYHDLLVTSVKISDIAILKFRSFVYRCIITKISKRQAINFNAKYRFESKRRNIIKYQEFIFHI